MPGDMREEQTEHSTAQHEFLQGTPNALRAPPTYAIRISDRIQQDGKRAGRGTEWRALPVSAWPARRPQSWACMRHKQQQRPARRAGRPTALPHALARGRQPGGRSSKPQVGLWHVQAPDTQCARRRHTCCALQASSARRPATAAGAGAVLLRSACACAAPPPLAALHYSPHAATPTCFPAPQPPAPAPGSRCRRTCSGGGTRTACRPAA